METGDFLFRWSRHGQFSELSFTMGCHTPVEQQRQATPAAGASDLLPLGSAAFCVPLCRQYWTRPLLRAWSEATSYTPLGVYLDYLPSRLSFICGSSASRSPSPNRLKPNTTNMIATPGIVVTWGAERK